MASSAPLMKVTACSHIDLIVLEVLLPVVGRSFFADGSSASLSKDLLLHLFRDFSVDLLLTSSSSVLFNECDGVSTSYSVPSSGKGLYKIRIMCLVMHLLIYGSTSLHAAVGA